MCNCKGLGRELSSQLYEIKYSVCENLQTQKYQQDVCAVLQSRYSVSDLPQCAIACLVLWSKLGSVHIASIQSYEAIFCKIVLQDCVILVIMTNKAVQTSCWYFECGDSHINYI